MSYPPRNLEVYGCNHEVVRGIVGGRFTLVGENHGKPVYKKDVQVKGVDVLLYYWDQRDGAEYSGWWFGPKVGGDQVWAQHPDGSSAMPPRQGWCVPYGGPVDPTFEVALSQAAPQQQQQQPQQQMMQQQPQQQGWGQQQQQPQQQQQWGQQQQMQQQPGFQQQGQQGYQQQQPGQAQTMQQQQMYAQQQQQAQQGWGQQQQQPQQQQQWGQQQQLQQQQGFQQQQQGFQQQQGQPQTMQQQQMYAQQQQQQMLQQQQQQMMLRQKQEEERARQRQLVMEAQQKQAEERKRQMEERQRKMAEQRAQQEAMMQAQREAAARKQMEVKAAFAIRKVIQRVRVATLDNYEALKQELEATLNSELAQCGEQREKVQDEASKGLEMAGKRVEQLIEKKRKEDEKRAEEAEKKRIADERAAVLAKELSILVEETDKVLQSQVAGLEPLEKYAELEPEELQARIQEYDDAKQNCLDKLKACADYIVENDVSSYKAPIRTQLPAAALAAKAAAQARLQLQQQQQQQQTNPEATPQVADGEAETANGEPPAEPEPPADPREELSKLIKTIGEMRQKSESLKNDPRRDVAAKNASARLKTKVLEASFKKYDKDKDGALNKTEFKMYAKEKLSLGKLADPKLVEKVFARFPEGTKSITFENLNLARCVAGTVLALSKDDARKKLRLEKEKLFEESKGKLEEKVKALSKEIDKTEAELTQAEVDVKPLLPKNTLSASAETKAMVSKAERSVERIRKKAAKHMDDFEKITDSFDKKCQRELKDHLGEAPLAKRCRMTARRMELRLARISIIAKRVGEQNSRLKSSELNVYKSSVLKVLRYNQQLKEWSNADLFKAMDTDENGTIDEEEFVSFFMDKEKELDFEVKLVKNSFMQKPAAPEPAQEVAEAPMAEEPKAEETKVQEGNAEETNAEEADGEATKLDEVMAEAEAAAAAAGEEAAKAAEVQEEKAKPPEEEDPDMETHEEAETFEVNEDKLREVFRQSCSEEQDELSKEDFDRLIRHVYAVSKSTPMTREFSIKDPTLLMPNPLHRFETGDLLEAVQGPLVDGSTGAIRVQVRPLIKDGPTGWVTLKGNLGTTFLKDGMRTFRVFRESPLSPDAPLTEEKKEEESAKAAAEAEEAAEGAEPKPDGEDKPPEDPAANAITEAAKAAQVLPKVKPGEVVEVLVWPVKDLSDNTFKIKAKAKSDGSVGWMVVTTAMGLDVAKVMILI